MEMNIEHLYKDELAFELSLRGLATPTSLAKKDLCMMLRPLLELESRKVKLGRPPYKPDIREELQTLKAKTEDLHTRANHRTDLSKSVGATYFSRAAHVLARIQLLSDLDLTEEQQTAGAELKEKLTEVLTIAASATEAADDTAEISVFAHTLSDLGSDDDTSPDDLNVSGPLANMNRPRNIERWGVKFGGDSSGTTLHTFLERVCELRVARNVSTQELFLSAVDLFEGKAMLWYRANRHRVHT